MTYEIISIRKRKTLRIKQPCDLYTVLKKYAKCKQEQFLTITLNGSHDIIGIHIITIGLVNKTIIHPREVFYRVVHDNACAMAVAHNHPSGNLEPSPEDFEIHERLVSASQIMGIHFLDNLIISKNGFYSMRENGRF